MRLSGYFDGLVVRDRNPVRAAAQLAAAYELGFRIIDTAPIYAKGYAESDIGQYSRRGEMRIWTKVGVDISTAIPSLDYTAEGMRRSLTGSLRRMRVESVDCAIVHNPIPSRINADEVCKFEEWCRATGVARRVGFSLLEPSHHASIVGAREQCIVMYELGKLADAGSPPWLASRTDLVIRSVFAGGATFRDARARRERMVDVVSKGIDLALKYGPKHIVIAPAGLRQLRSYAQ